MTEEMHVLPARPPLCPRLGVIVLAHWKILLLGAGIGIVIGVTLALLKPKTYTSTATLLFPAAPPSRLSMLAGNAANDLPSLPLLEGALLVPQTATSAATATVLLKSRRVQKDLIQSQNLKAEWKLARMKDVRERFAESLICRIGRDGELYVGFKDESSDRAFTLTGALVAKLGELAYEMGYSSAEKNVEILQRQVAESEVAMSASQTQMLAFQRKHRVIDVSEQAKALAVQYATLQQDVMTSRIEATTAIRQVNMMANSAGTLIQACIDPVPGSTAGATLAPLYQKVMGLESELALLKQKLTADHPDVQEKTDELKVAQGLLRAEMKRQLGVLKTGSSPVVSTAVISAAVSKARFEGLQAALQEMQGAVDQLPKQQATYARLRAELEANAERVKLFREQYEKAQLIKDTRGPLFSVLDEPETALSRDPSGGSLVVLFCLVLGVAIAAIMPYRRWLQELQAFEDAETPSADAA